MCFPSGETVKLDIRGKAANCSIVGAAEGAGAAVEAWAIPLIEPSRKTALNAATDTLFITILPTPAGPAKISPQ